MTAILLALCGVVSLIVFWRYWLHQEREKAERAKFTRIASACSESRPWSSPASKGFQQRGRR